MVISNRSSKISVEKTERVTESNGEVLFISSVCNIVLFYNIYTNN